MFTCYEEFVYPCIICYQPKSIHTTALILYLYLSGTRSDLVDNKTCHVFYVRLFCSFVRISLSFYFSVMQIDLQVEKEIYHLLRSFFFFVCKLRKYVNLETYIIIIYYISAHIGHVLSINAIKL